ncbi:MAG: hypothetical protein NTZ74_10570 [Chloroflexi bacterium]|nr:hypothetical protein [Chloroflexota bacterium]
MNEKRGPWYLLTGLVIGLLIGIAFSKWIFPVQYSNTEPYSLREPDKKIYRSVIAQAFLVEADTKRALTRLGLLRDTDPSGALIAQAQSMLGAPGNEIKARALALLASAVNQPSVLITPLSPIIRSVFPTATDLPTITITITSTETPAIEVSPMNSPTLEPPTLTPSATFTPRPTSTPQPTLGPPFVLDGEPVLICDPLPEIPLLEVVVLNAAGDPVPGVKIEISQTGGGVESFYTGLYPEINRGYADYEMLSGMEYAIRVGDAGQLVSNLVVPICAESPEGPLLGSLHLKFRQP